MRAQSPHDTEFVDRAVLLAIQKDGSLGAPKAPQARPHGMDFNPF
jgi:hypothetical protein